MSMRNGSDLSIWNLRFPSKPSAASRESGGALIFYVRQHA
jgi:hypothetical protein